jgi:hypothetical protein
MLLLLCIFFFDSTGNERVLMDTCESNEEVDGVDGGEEEEGEEVSRIDFIFRAF